MASALPLACLSTRQRNQASVRELAARQGLTESALLKCMVDLSLQSVTPDATGLSHMSHVMGRAIGRDQRVYVRLRVEDQRLLQARAAARNLAPATYVSVLVRSHLYGVAPLPQEELTALRSSLNELAAIRCYAQALANMAVKNSQLAGPHSQEVVAMVKVLEVAHTRFKALLLANLKSWNTGN